MTEQSEKSELEQLEEQIRAQRAANAELARERGAAGAAARLRHTLAYEKAKQQALVEHAPHQLIETVVLGIGECLFRFPDEVTYNHFMKGTGAIRGDLSKMTMEAIEDLVARCALFPRGPEFLQLARKENPHSRTVLAQLFLERMRDRMTEEGK